MPYGCVQQSLTEPCRSRDSRDKENVIDTFGKPEDSMHACLTILVEILTCIGGHDADKICYDFPFITIIYILRDLMEFTFSAQICPYLRCTVNSWCTHMLNESSLMETLP